MKEVSRFMITCCRLVIAAVLLAGFHSICIGAEASKAQHSPHALSGVDPEMLTPEYWIALQDDADKVIMTPQEIERFNEKVRNKRVTFLDYYGRPDPLSADFALTEIKGPVMNPLQPLRLPDTLPGDSFRVRLESNIKWLFSRDFYDNRNAIYNENMNRDIVEAMDLKSIPNIIKRRFGIAINHAMIRYYPTSVPEYSDTQTELDFFQATFLLMGNPVTVLQRSHDGDFLYIESPTSRGWVSARDIAFADRETVRSLSENKNFLMATAHKVPIYGDPSFTNFDRYFYFSTILPMVRKNDRGYVVTMPCRKPDGSLVTTNGYIRPDADVHVGYLPYTKRNVLIQMFKLLDQPYGWCDQDNKRSCAGTIRVLIGCFGIITGRSPNFLLSASDHQVYINPSLSTEEKMAEVAKIEPVITMAGNSGHIVLYLGKARNGKLYFIHQAGWGYDENGTHFIVNRETVNPADHQWYSIRQPNVFTTMKLYG